MVTAYPLLPVRRRFWKEVVQKLDESGNISQLPNQLRIAHEAVSATGTQSLGGIQPDDDLAWVFGWVRHENLKILQRESGQATPCTDPKCHPWCDTLPGRYRCVYSRMRGLSGTVVESGLRM